jgi:hypothetical protein
LNFSEINFFNSGIPLVGVYLVKPWPMASIAAVLMNSGVSKSGSPAARLTISSPSAFSLFAFEVMARVGEGLIALSRSAIIRNPFPF